jgi:hypothetical protein
MSIEYLDVLEWQAIVAVTKIHDHREVMIEHLLLRSLGMESEPRSKVAVRMDRKAAAVSAARRCGQRIASASPAADLYRTLDELDGAVLTKTEQRARDQLLPMSWRAAFSQGWRSATS